MRRWRPSAAESGAAVVDFVLVALVLVPLVLGLLQVGLTLYVRNALAAAAAEGARYAATTDRGPGDGVARTRAQLDGVVGHRFLREVSSGYVERDGTAVVEVRVRAVVPPLGLWGPGLELDVVGHAVREQAP
ncbi:MAG: TadE/TadG family type IV pilus assembly protein [Marmoricola sp.]